MPIEARRIGYRTSLCSPMLWSGYRTDTDTYLFDFMVNGLYFGSSLVAMRYRLCPLTATGINNFIYVCIQFDLDTILIIQTHL